MTSPYYLRKWKISAILKNGDVVVLSNSDDEPKALRVTFHIARAGYQAWYYGDINVWNLTHETRGHLLREGSNIVVEAGYKDGNFGKIFEGSIFQALIGRENVVDLYLSLHCIDGDIIFNKNFIKFTMSAKFNHKALIEQIAKNARIPIPVEKITDNVSTKEMPRGKTVFGGVKKPLRDIAVDNSAQIYIKDGKFNMSKLTDESKKPAIVLSPTTGLIGTPQQIDYGVSFRCLLNPLIEISNPPMVVKLDQAVIREKKLYIKGSLPTLLAQDGIYKVAGVTHVGDTRGNDWYTDVVGVNWIGKQLEYVISKDMRP